ncbi:MAG: PL29 family lyase N-terminal domain-containing protein [Fermentimonas sp.]
MAVLAMFVAFTACQDYDDDISSLESKIGNLQQTLNEIQSKIDGGAVITNVTSTANGITITLSNGKSYNITNGKDGADGADGADGSVVTIGENGNWFIDGEDTGFASKGADGADGADGKDGVYYEPNADGFWHKIDPNTVPATDTSTGITWLPEGTLTGVYNPADGTVQLNNVKGVEGPYILGAKVLTSLVFYPELYIDGVESLEFRPMVFNYGNPEPVFTWGCEILPLIPPEEPDVPCIATIGEEYVYAPGLTVRFLGSKPVPAAYHVSPSALKLAMIDKDNLEVTSHGAEFRFRLGGVEDDNDNPFTATFKKLEKGKIFVDYDVNYVNLAKAYGVQPLVPELINGSSSSVSTFNEGVLALQVPHSKAALNMLPNGADMYVTSDYAQFHIHPIDASKIDILVPVATEVDGTDVLSPAVTPELYRTLPDYLGLTEALGTPESYYVGDLATPVRAYAAKKGANYNHPVSYVVMEEGQTINLIDYVRAGLSETAAVDGHECEYVPLYDSNNAPNVFDPFAYNMKWEFALLDSNGDAIVYEHIDSETDQQQFIDLIDPVKGTVKAKVYEDPAHGAAVGREPIVRVRLIYGDDCLISEAFINIKIVKDSLDDLEITITASGHNVGCDPLTATLTTEEMNRQVYNVLGISKELFKQRYVGTTGIFGTIYSNVDVSMLTGNFAWDIDANTGLTTDKPVWTVSPCDCEFDWVTEYAKVSGYVTITPLDGVGPNIVIYFYGELRSPTIDLTEDDLQKAYWLDDFSAIKHNVAVPVMPNHANPNYCTFNNNLNEAFKQRLLGHLWLGENYIFYRYRFADADKQITGLKYSDGGDIVMSVSDDRKTLYASTPGYQNGALRAVATITDHTILNGQDILSYQDNRLALYLLNLGKQTMWAKLTIDAWCNDVGRIDMNCEKLTVNINGNDEFKVVFLRPLEIVSEHKEYFQDGATGGQAGSYITASKLWMLEDWRGIQFNQTSPTTPVDQTHLWNFYGVESVQIRLTQSVGPFTSTLVEWDGNGDWETIPNTIEVGWQTGSGETYPRVTYLNNGTPLDNCNLRFPVRITYKWGYRVNYWIVVPVKKTLGQ